MLHGNLRQPRFCRLDGIPYGMIASRCCRCTFPQFLGTADLLLLYLHHPEMGLQSADPPPMPCICARCSQPIKRVKLKDGSIMQAAEFASTHEGMCANCYKATRLNVA